MAPTQSDDPEVRRARTWRRWEVWAAVVAALAATVTLGFVAIQTQQATRTLKSTNVTGQIQYNLQVMERLDDVLDRIAREPSCASYVWSKAILKRRPTEGSLAMVCGDSLLDVLSMAMKADHCMPDFSTNHADWSDYIKFQLKSSPNLVRRIKDNKTWWPELDPFVHVAQAQTRCS